MGMTAITGRRRALGRATLASGLLAVTTLVGIGVAAPAAHVPSKLDYVALGDSYWPAHWTDRRPATSCVCSRRPATPMTRRRYLGASLTDVSCSGADSANVTASSQYPGRGAAGRRPVTGHAAGDPDRRGNDNDLFVSALLACGVTDILDVFNIGSPCKAVYGNTFTNEVAADASTVKQTFATVKADAPNAQVYVLGYPDILPSSGGCYPTVPLTNGDTSYLNNLELDLNSTIQAAAAAAGVHYVSTYSQFEGHGSCATGSKQWINAIISTSGGISVHPNATGEQQMADILEAALAADGISYRHPSRLPRRLLTAPEGPGPRPSPRHPRPDAGRSPIPEVGSPDASTYDMSPKR